MCSFPGLLQRTGLVSFRDISPSAFEVTVLFLGETVGCRGFIRPSCVLFFLPWFVSACYWPLGVVSESNPPSWYRVQAAASSGVTWLLVPWRTGSCMTECAHLKSFLLQKMACLFFFFFLEFVWLYFFIFKIPIFIYLAVPGLQSSLGHVGSISWPGSNPRPPHWERSLSPWATREVPLTIF